MPVKKTNNQPSGSDLIRRDMAAQITKLVKRTNWILGKVGGYEFEAMVFSEGSVYGIDEGRISKLNIYNPKYGAIKGSIINYDRMWYKKPDNLSYPIYEAVLNLLNSLPVNGD